MAKLVEDVYGNALFELAVEQNRIDAFYEEADGILAVLEANPELTGMMTHPQIVKEEKLETIDTVFKGHIADETLGLMRMVIEKDHFANMEGIFHYFADRVKAYRNIGVCYVSTPVELSDAQKKAVEARLLDTTDYVSFEMHYAIEPELIGGMVIRIGDRVVDSSVKTKIEHLSRELSKTRINV
ncbi:MAG: ATP synthase F1 subunit delta [Lachnospiraceae bacterium]|nr:ATP synthase F1 subunit delta [Lachnospiraceae bacterium]